MPPKIRELIAIHGANGFKNRVDKGSHHNFTHPKASRPIAISGQPGDDAKAYQVKAVRAAIEEIAK